MSNPFYYLAGLLLLAGYPTGHEPLVFARTPVAPWAALGGVALYAALCWGVVGSGPRHPGLARELLRVLALILYAQLLFVFHFPLWVWQLGLEDDPLAGTALGLAPLFALYGILAFVHNRFHPRSGGLRFAFRSFAGLSLLPLSLILLLDEAFVRIDALGRLAFIYPAFAWVFALGCLVLLMVALPLLLRLVLGARPLAPGALRDRLERMADAAGYGGARILVVPTGTSRMANAFVAGLSARWRYIFFTEAILEGMTGDELDCVLAHEVTHARKRHILFYLVSALAFSLFSGLAHQALEEVGVPAPVLILMMLTWAAVYWGLAFGYVSRRFETEADLVAARVVPAVENGLAPYGAARKMAAALHRVAVLNRVPISAWSWRHFPLAKRIDILLRTEGDPAIGLAFEKTCDRLRSAALALVLGGVACGVVLFGMQRGQADANRTLWEAHETAEQGHRELLAGNYGEALTLLQRGIDGGSTSAVVWFWRADAERALGRDGDAARSEAEARRRGYSDPRLRLRGQP